MNDDLRQSLRLCAGCDQPMSEHIGPPSPPRVPGHLGHRGERVSARCMLTGGRVFDHDTKREVNGKGYPSSGHSVGGVPIHGNDGVDELVELIGNLVGLAQWLALEIGNDEDGARKILEEAMFDD